MAEDVDEVYYDDPHEEVMVRKCTRTGKIFLKFYGGAEQPKPVTSAHRLYYEARFYGRQISLEQYLKGRPALMDNE